MCLQGEIIYYSEWYLHFDAIYVFFSLCVLHDIPFSRFAFYCSIWSTHWLYYYKYVYERAMWTRNVYCVIEYDEHLVMKCAISWVVRSGLVDSTLLPSEVMLYFSIRFWFLFSLTTDFFKYINKYILLRQRAHRELGLLLSYLN